MKKTIVLAADFKSALQTLTTIKSIVFHNRNVDFYLFNRDFPREWFKNVRSFLKTVESNIHDIKVDVDEMKLSTYTSGVASITTYFRYFIPRYCDSDVVLYLDTDLIVTGDLTPLFEIDFSQHSPEYYAAAVQDFCINEPFLNSDSYFNAGVLVFNNRLLKSENMTDIFLQLADENNHLIQFGDQSILNLAFKERWLKLEDKYNFMVGLDYIYEERGNHSEMRFPEFLPTIIHYPGVMKPWSTNLYVRYRELWWHYCNLEWSEIQNKKHKTELSFFILTDSDSIESIEKLLVEAPEWHFYIAAKTEISWKLMRLLEYENCTVYRSILDVGVQELIDSCDAYLDINYGSQVSNVLERFNQKGKPVFGYFGTTHDDRGSSILVDTGNVEELIATINSYFTS